MRTNIVKFNLLIMKTLVQNRVIRLLFFVVTIALFFKIVYENKIISGLNKVPCFYRILIITICQSLIGF